MSGEKIYLRNPDVAIRDEDESGSMLFNPDTGGVLVINDTGRFIWSLCTDWITIDGMVARFHDEYEDLPESLNEEIEQFIASMLSGGFIATK